MARLNICRRVALRRCKKLYWGMTQIDLTIPPREADIGGMPVRRILPYVKRRMVGPFVFLDHMGPAHFNAHQGIDVAPHPHIGLATVTYLFSGEIFHRDTLGSAQAITPGAVNWMTAGRGIAHSERTTPAEKSRPHDAHGLQSWVALPKEFEECAPEFFHHGADTLPEFNLGGATLRIIAGRAFGYEAPVKIHSPLFYAAVTMPAGSSIRLDAEYAERALYLVKGGLRIGDDRVTAATMPVFASGDTVTIEAEQDSTVMLLGGDPLPEPRYIDWNFVSSSKERLLQARDDWRHQRFGKIPGDDKDFVPLP